MEFKQVFRTLIYSVTQFYRKQLIFHQQLPRLWYGTRNNDSQTQDPNAVTEGQLTLILKNKFPQAKEIQVEDVSGGCGQMFNIYVETEEFQGKAIATQHREVYAAIDDEIKRIHGVRVLTKVVKAGKESKSQQSEPPKK